MSHTPDPEAQPELESRNLDSTAPNPSPEPLAETILQAWMHRSHPSSRRCGSRRRRSGGCWRPSDDHDA